MQADPTLRWADVFGGTLSDVISLTVLVDSIHIILIFFAEKNVSSFCTAKATHIFSAKNFSIFAYHSM